MAQKHLLTVVHCVMAVLVTPAGLVGAGIIADRQPLPALIVAGGAVILPVLIATRVAWASGYAAGRQAAGEAVPTRAQHSTAAATDDPRIQRLPGGPGR